MPKYETYQNTIGETFIMRYDEDGKIWSIPNDPANSDYQAYLNKDNPKQNEGKLN